MFKRVLLVLGLLLGLTRLSYADIIGPYARNIASGDGISTEIIVDGTATLYTTNFSLQGGEFFGVAYKASSVAGAPTVKIELEESAYDLKTAYQGAASVDYVEPENFSDIETTLTSETWHIKSLSPVPAPYGRFKLTGNSGNQSDTIVQIKLLKAEN